MAPLQSIESTMPFSYVHLNWYVSKFEYMNEAVFLKVKTLVNALNVTRIYKPPEN